MHSALRPKPAVKLPPPLIPSTPKNHVSASVIKKSPTHSNDHYQKSIKPINGHHKNSLTFNSTTNEKVYWSLGLKNCKGKYLTAETFGCKINATGISLKKKQIWTIIYDSQHDYVYLQSPLNYYLSVDKYGRLKCDSNELDNECRFQLEYHRNGQWAFKSLTYGMYLGGDMDQLHCFSKAPEWWSPHLAIHPQINLKHIVRKCYAKLDEDEIHVDEIIPWGSNAIVAVEYVNEGHYCIRSSNGYYVHKDGKLIAQQTDETLYTIELYKGYLTFKDCEQCYLTAIGPLGILTTRNKVAGKDEQFSLEESKLQICLIAPNGKLVSTKQGIDLSANQHERDHSSIFQLEYDDDFRAYHVRTYDNKYWKVHGFNIQAVADKKSLETSFQIQSAGHGRITFQTLNGKYIVPHPTGHMRIVNDQMNSSDAYFQMKFINRPFCVFKCDFGHIGYRHKQSRLLECNKSLFTLFTLEEPTDRIQGEGNVYLKGTDGLYWILLSDLSISANGSEPSKFSLELCSSHSRIVIKAPNGMYLRAEQNGSLQATCQNSRQATQWEF